MVLKFAKTLLLMAVLTELAISHCPASSISASASGSCFLVVDSPMSYNRAKRFCLDYFDGTLASVADGNDNWNIMLMSRKRVRGGYYSSVWVGGYFDGKNVTWEDGTTERSYSNFESGSANPGNIYVQTTNGIWGTQNYTTKLPFVCVSKNTTTKPFCPKFAVKSSTGDSCYFPVNISLTYNKAQHFCVDYFGANLASIPSSQDNDIVLQEMRYFFGDDAVNLWLGGLYDGVGLRWEDGTKATFTNFRDEEPTPGYNIFLDLISGKWPTTNYRQSYQFLCRNSNAPPTPSPSSPPTQTPPPKTSTPRVITTQEALQTTACSCG